MRDKRRLVAHRLLWVCLAMLLFVPAGCRGRPASNATPTAERAASGANGPQATQVRGLLPAEPRMTATRQASAPAEGQADVGQPAPTARANSGQMVEWPEGSFRYEVRWRPAGEPSALETVVSGQYRSATWQQTARTGAAAAEELLVYAGNTYTRPAGESNWTRWPGLDFATAYGLASPFTLLRLYQMAGPSGRGTPEPLDGAQEPAFRKQLWLPAGLVTRALQAGVAATGMDEEGRASLAQQIELAGVPQTITFWAGESGRVYRAEGTLQVLESEQGGRTGDTASGHASTGVAERAAPWIDITWRFWDYDDRQITVNAPAQFAEAPGAETKTAAGLSEPRQTLNADLTVHVFAAPGVRAREVAVTVYAAGERRKPLDWHSEPSASFSLPAGRYDVRVQMLYTEEWLLGLEVSPDVRVSRNVTFDFGTLQLATKRAGADVTAEIVSYPAGQRQNWVDRRSGNPAIMQLRAGTYDVEITYGAERAMQTVEGLVVRAGEVTAKTVELK